MENNKLLIVKGVTKSYIDSNNIANDNISFYINRGEILGLFGPNGSGKTTLVRQITGILKPDKGKIILEGVDVTKNNKKIRDCIASLNQVMYGHRALKAEEFVACTGIYRGLKKNDAMFQAEYFFDYFGISNIKNNLMESLSGGERRIIGFISTLIGFKPLMILDEPTNDLDPKKRILLWNMIKELKIKLGISFLLVTHNIHEAENVVDRVVILRDGKCILGDIPQKIINDYSDNYIIKFYYPYNYIIEDSIIKKFNIVRVSEEIYEIHTNRENINNKFIELINSDLKDHMGNIDIVSPSLESVYIENFISK